MRFLLFFILVGLSFSDNAQSAKVKKLHEKAILVDTHNDVLTSLTLEGKYF